MITFVLGTLPKPGMPLSLGDGGNGGTTYACQSGHLALTKSFFREESENLIGEVTVEHG